jgi:hypothetical protein
VGIKKISILVLITVAFSAITIAVCAKVYSVLTITNYGKEKLPGLSDAQYEHALRNRSTAPNYVLIWLVDKSKEENEKKQICVEGPYFLGAIQRKYKLNTDEQAIQFALEQKDRTFELAIETCYTQKMLDEVRALLAGRSKIEMVKLLNDHKSSLYKLCVKNPDLFYYYFDAIAHVLSEHGILCGRGCESPMIYIDDWKEDQPSLPSNESQIY